MAIDAPPNNNAQVSEKDVEIAISAPVQAPPKKRWFARSLASASITVLLLTACMIICIAFSARYLHRKEDPDKIVRTALIVDLVIMCVCTLLTWVLIGAPIFMACRPGADEGDSAALIKLGVHCTASISLVLHLGSFIAVVVCLSKIDKSYEVWAFFIARAILSGLSATIIIG